MATLPTAAYCSADAAPSKMAESCADKQIETVITRARISNEISSSDEEFVPLPLEVIIPKERLPDVLDVYNKDSSAFLSVITPYAYSDFNKNKDALLRILSGDPARLAEYHSLEKFLARSPVKFVRKYPVCIPTTLEGEEVIGDVSKASANLDCRTIGQLDLSQKRLGSGNHSYVFLASFTLPSCAAPPLRGEVAVKLAKVRLKDREMLENEAKIYDEFPCELQESTASSPPAVSKFFGYYTPSCESVDSYKDDGGDEESARTVRRDVCKLLQSIISPILLLEPCGEPIKAGMPSTSNGDTICGMFDRLHNAGFTQKSNHWQNLLVQPGPLTDPRAERSFNNPSYRIIDFGRGKCYKGDESQSEETMNERKAISLLIREGCY